MRGRFTVAILTLLFVLASGASDLQMPLSLIIESDQAAAQLQNPPLIRPLLNLVKNYYLRSAVYLIDPTPPNQQEAFEAMEDIGEYFHQHRRQFAGNGAEVLLQLLIQTPAANRSPDAYIELLQSFRPIFEKFDKLFRGELQSEALLQAEWAAKKQDMFVFLLSILAATVALTVPIHYIENATLGVAVQFGSLGAIFIIGRLFSKKIKKDRQTDECHKLDQIESHWSQNPRRLEPVIVEACQSLLTPIIPAAG